MKFDASHRTGCQKEAVEVSHQSTIHACSRRLKFESLVLGSLNLSSDEDRLHLVPCALQLQNVQVTFLVTYK